MIDDKFEEHYKIWNDFKDTVVNKSRYFFGQGVIEPIKKLAINNVISINNNTSFYRARIYNNDSYLDIIQVFKDY